MIPSGLLEPSETQAHFRPRSFNFPLPQKKTSKMSRTIPDLGDRILARIDRREAAIAKVRRDLDIRLAKKHAARPQAVTASATARWKAAVGRAAQTMPRAQAVISVDQSHPGLRKQMLAEVNAQRTTAQPRAVRSVARPHGGATARWKSALAQARETMSPGDAVMFVNSQNPGLREKMLNEVNA